MPDHFRRRKSPRRAAAEIAMVQLSRLLEPAKIGWRHMPDEPDTVVRTVEMRAGLPHALRRDGEDGWFPVPPADAAGGFRLGGEMDVGPRAGPEAVGQDGRNRMDRGAMEQDGRRFTVSEIQGHLDGMPLGRPNPRTVPATG